MSPRPPRGWERLLALVLRGDDRDAALGDLAEEHAARAGRDGAPAARRWYRRQALRSLAPALTARVRRIIRGGEGVRGGEGAVAARLRDARYAVRTLRRSPAFAATALLTLGLGIGAAAAVYTVTDAVLLRPLPYPDADRLHVLHQERDGDRLWVSAPNYQDWRERLDAFEELAAFSPDGFNAVVDGEAERVSMAEVTANFFRTLGIEPALGRGFTADEARTGAAVAVIADGLWRRRLGGDPAALGSTLTLDGTAYRIVGVLPPMRPLRDGTEVWTPIRFGAADWRTRRGIGWVLVVGRLRPGVDIAAARAEADAVGAALAEAHPDANGGTGIALRTLAEEVVGDVRGPLRVLMACVVLVLLVVCSNVGGLLVARGVARRGEWAVRAAVGGGRRALAAQVATEGTVLAVAGGLLGVAFARLGVDAIVALAPPGTPRLDEITAGGPTVGFALAATAVAAVLFGLLPAARLLGSARARVPGRARAGRALTPRLRQGLVVAQVATALVLLAGAGLLARSFWRLSRVDLGFQPEGALVATLPTTTSSFDSDEAMRLHFEAIVERARALPGVRAAGLINAAPLVSAGPTYSYELRDPPDDPDARLLARYRVVTPGVFEALGMRFVRGRSFLPEEAAADGPRAIVVDESWARAHFPDRDPLGEEVGILDAWWTIVGVVATPRDVAVEEVTGRHLYVPMARHLRETMSLVLRTDGDPAALLPALRREVRALDPAQPLTPAGPLTRWVDDAVAQPRFTTALLGFFAGATLALSALGLYGLLAYTVTVRTREIGVRMALGAAAAHVRGMVVRQGMALAALGLVTGLFLAWLAGPLLEGLLFEVDARDPAVLAAVAALLTGVSWAAAWLPARRATHVAPSRALRQE